MITADPQLDDVKTALKLGPTISSASLWISKSYGSPSRMRWKPRACVLRCSRCAGKCAGTPDITKSSPSRRRSTELMSFVQKVAASEATTILIQGESGTGKDLIAKTIHYESSRQNGRSSPSTARQFPKP